MDQNDLLRRIRQMIRTEIARTLLGSITTTDNSFLTSVKRFSTDSEMGGLRLIRPYGIASRPPKGTNTVVHPNNGDPTHLISLGDFDLNRPIIESNEVCLYSSGGQIVYMENGGNVTIGDYLPATGIILPTYRAKFSQNGKSDIKNLLGNITLNSDGSAAVKNLLGGVTVNASGTIDLAGSVAGAIQGAGLGLNIQTRLSLLESAFSTFITAYTLHMHPTAAPGPPSPPIIPGIPFVPTPLPAESLTVKVSL